MTGTDVNELADEFAENGLYDAAEYLREHGVAATLRWLDETAIPEAREDDRLWHHGEGFELGNLEVARDRLNAVSPRPYRVTVAFDIEASGDAEAFDAACKAAAERDAELVMVEDEDWNEVAHGGGRE